jgi:hypothetical protein
MWKTYRFSKDRQVHEAMTYLTLYGCNSYRCVRTLRVKGEDGRWRARTPAVDVGLTDHVWTWREWFTRPAVQAPWDTTVCPRWRKVVARENLLVGTRPRWAPCIS